jgi:hypothetical protein
MYGLRICNEYMKGLDAFIDFVKKICWTMLEESLLSLQTLQE